MERKSDFSPVLLVLLGLLGLSAGGAHFTKPGPADGNSAGAPSAEPPEKETGPRRDLDQERLVGALPALELLAEYLGQRTEDVEAEITLEEVREKTPLSVDKDSPWVKDRDLYLEALRKETFARRLMNRLRREAEAQGVTIEFVIATLPDYVDSYSAWMFDPSLDALQRAAGAAGYVVDRFELPDRGPVKAGASPGGRHRHEREPAAVLFRCHENPKSMLMVLVPLETATAGVHPRAFTSALALASTWNPASRIKILGPTFSGSTPSLQRFLRLAVDQGILGKKAPDETTVEIVSGSATSPTNKKLEDAYEGSGIGVGRHINVTFRATSVDDKTAEEALASFLGSVDENWAQGIGVALVVESNTAWGDERLLRAKKPFPMAETLTFPLHVSRLRALATDGKPASPHGSPASASASPDDEPPTPTDLLPSLTPNLTAATLQVALGNVLDGIERLRVQAVGLYGTDARDKLFLAEQISRRFPNVLLFTLEGHLLYLEPDYRAYARGMVVASSYPLFVLSPTASHGPRTYLQQFSSAGTQGTYNALLALLFRPDLMLDYGDAASGKPCLPSVWVSLVGQESLWPVERKPIVNAWHYSWTTTLGPPPDGGAAGQGRPATYAWPASVVVVAALLLVAVGFHLVLGLMLLAPKGDKAPKLVQWMRSRLAVLEVPKIEGTDSAKKRGPSLRQEWLMALLACWGPLGVVSIWALGLALVGLGPIEPGRLKVTVGALWVVMGLGALATFVGVLLSTTEWNPRAVVLTLVRSATLVLVVLLQYEVFQAVTGPLFTGDLALFNVARAVRPETLVSPSVPIFFLAATMYLWGLLNLWRLHQQAAEFPSDMPLTKVLDRCVSETEAAAPGEERAKDGGPGAELIEALNDPLLWLRPLPALLVLVALAVQGVGVWRYGRVPDGVYLKRVLGLGTLLALFLIGHALTHSVALARTLLRALRALSLHPLAAVFASLGDKPFLWRLSFGAPTGGDLAPLLLSVGGLSEALEDDWRIQKPGWPLVLCETFPLTPDESRRPFNATAAWQSLGGPCSTLVALLEKKQWAEHPYPEVADKGKSARPSPWHEAETFLALHMAYVIKHALVRVTRSLGFVIAGLVLVMAAHLFYTFEGRGFWLGLDWALLGLGVLVAILLLVAFERDPILSHLWGSEPGQIGFRSEFVQRILLYGALPVITLFTTFFPEVGASLFSWLEPVRKALP